MKTLRPKIPSLCYRCFCSRQKFFGDSPQKRFLSVTSGTFADSQLGDILQAGLDSIDKPTPTPVSGGLGALYTNKAFAARMQQDPRRQDSPKNSAEYSALQPLNRIKGYKRELPPFHLNVFATRHNCHITLSRELPSAKRKTLISVSSGNLGFRKAARGTYDAAYQLGAYVMGRMQDPEIINQIHALELTLRDFGPGREAITKILLGNEGRMVRGLIVRVMDATRLKFGGTRGKKPRRLG